jgi:hypothetical protein
MATSTLALHLHFGKITKETDDCGFFLNHLKVSSSVIKSNYHEHYYKSGS